MPSVSHTPSMYGKQHELLGITISSLFHVFSYSCSWLIMSLLRVFCLAVCLLICIWFQILEHSFSNFFKFAIYSGLFVALLNERLILKQGVFVLWTVLHFIITWIGILRPLLCVSCIQNDPQFHWKLERWISAPPEFFPDITFLQSCKAMKVSKTLHYNSSAQAAGAKLCQNLGVFTGVVDSWSAKNSYSGNLCGVCVRVTLC